VHCAVGHKDIAQRPKAEIRVAQMVEDAGTDDLIESPPEIPDLLDREPMELEVS
jgi:hypothetical protein